MDGRIDARIRGLGGDLGVLTRVLELKLVEKIVRSLSGRRALNREAGEVLGAFLIRKIEGEKSLIIAWVSFDSEGILARRSNRHVTLNEQTPGL
jgi:hypothetical protein